jgi:hypothetical protein
MRRCLELIPNRGSGRDAARYAVREQTGQPEALNPRASAKAERVESAVEIGDRERVRDLRADQGRARTKADGDVRSCERIE